MAKPSDLLGEIAEVTAEHAPAPQNGPTYGRVDSQRRQRESARRMEAMALRLAGLTFTQIGERLQISPDGAKDMIRRTLTRAENTATEQERELENARLDRAQAAIWSDVLAGDLKAVDTFLRLSARRAKMNGFDAPTNINLSVNVRQEMEQALANLETIILGEVTSSRVLDPAE